MSNIYPGWENCRVVRIGETITVDMRPKRSKYRAEPTKIDGIRFASKKEAAYYRDLVMLEAAGEVRHIQRQVAYELMVNGTRIGKYLADFVFDQRVRVNGASGIEFAWRSVVVDVKGFPTPLYRWKKKHVTAQYGITVVEV